MVRWLSGALAVLSLVGLVACGPIYQTQETYVVPKKPQVKRCVNRCLRDRSKCRMDCKQLNNRCHIAADRAARPDYAAYVRHQKHYGFSVTKRLSDFADYSQCRAACGCESDYRQCYTHCGGVVLETRQCVAFCPESQ